jgi:hypothetical protein
MTTPQRLVALRTIPTGGVPYQMDFIIGTKPGGNPTLFQTVQARLQKGLCTEWEEADEKSGATRGYRFTHQVPLHHAHPDLDSAVNFLRVLGSRRPG